VENSDVAAQQLVPPRQATAFQLELPAGAYRVRAKRCGASVDMHISDDGPAVAQVSLHPGIKGTQPVRLKSGGARLEVTMDDSVTRLVIVERVAWKNDAATAARVTTMQEFRTLFPHEAVAAGEQIAVRNMAFLFSDLKGSTSMYDRVGDGPAYSTVKEHFDLLEQRIADNGGAVVKTIGDAVMAAFSSPEMAMKAAVEIQQRMPGFNARRQEKVVIKIGIHAGPCVAVNANGKLDYFGSTVNVAARVQGQSVGDDIVVVESLLEDPAVRALCETQMMERYTSTLAGIARPFELVRLRPSVVTVAPSVQPAPAQWSGR